MCHISRQSDVAFACYSSFCKCAKRGRKIRREKKTKKLSQFLKSHTSGTLEEISLNLAQLIWLNQFCSVHSKNRLVSSRQHRATEVRKLRFLSSCQYTHGCCTPASCAARHTTVFLDLHKILNCLFQYVFIAFAKKNNRFLNQACAWFTEFVFVKTCVCTYVPVYLCLSVHTHLSKVVIVMVKA